MTTRCGISVFGLGEDRRDWLRRALRDIGLPVGGWGEGFNSDGRYFNGRHQRPFSMDVLGEGRAVKAALEDLVANEVLGYPIKVEVRYG